MLVVTTEAIPGQPIAEALGLARGNVVRSKNVGKDIIASFRNIIGGEVNEYTSMIAGAREQAYDRMVEDARRQGADAIVGMRFTTSTAGQGQAEILAFGTAVAFLKVLKAKTKSLNASGGSCSKCRRSPLYGWSKPSSAAWRACRQARPNRLQSCWRRIGHKTFFGRAVERIAHQGIAAVIEVNADLRRAPCLQAALNLAGEGAKGLHHCKVCHGFAAIVPHCHL